MGTTQYPHPLRSLHLIMVEEELEEAAFGTLEASQRADWEGLASLKVSHLIKKDEYDNQTL